MGCWAVGFVCLCLLVCLCVYIKGGGRGGDIFDCDCVHIST